MERIVYIDYLRNFANLTRCFLHASVPYMVTVAPVWPVDDAGSWFFDFTVFEIHLFVMELFFVISGFMFAMEMKNKPINKIIKNRFKRIVIPFILGLILFVPIVLTYFSLGNYTGFTFFQFEIIKQSYVDGWNLAFENFFPTAHLWFLYYLIFFYVITLIFKGVIQKINLSILKILFLGIIISSSSMFFMERWIVDNPLTLLPELPSFIHYYLFFIIGILLYTSKNHMLNLKKISRNLLYVGCILAFLAIIPQLWFEKTDSFYYTYIKISAIILSCSSIYLLTIGLWGYFSKLELRDSKLLRYLTDSSYWVYLSNMPIVILFHIVLIPLDVSVFLKFITSFVGALTVSFLTYEYLVRYTFVGGILNKRRMRK